MLTFCPVTDVAGITNLLSSTLIVIAVKAAPVLLVNTIFPVASVLTFCPVIAVVGMFVKFASLTSIVIGVKAAPVLLVKVTLLLAAVTSTPAIFEG